MGGPLSVILSNIFMNKLENEVVVPIKPDLFRRFVDDIISKRLKNRPDSLLQKLNQYHAKIKFTVEVAPTKFLDTRIIYNPDNTISTEVYRSSSKLPVPWSSKVPNRYKRNAINSDLYRAKRISSNFDNEVNRIKNKFSRAGFPVKFTESVIRDFNDKNSAQPINNEDEFIIPPWLFKESKRFILVELPYCKTNEIVAKHFLRKIHQFTDESYDIAIKWHTRKIRSLFPLKDRNPHPSCVIYKGTCSCSACYVGETARNAETRWNEHNDPTKKSEPSCHLNKNVEHSFTWEIISSAPKHMRKRKILEAYYIAKIKPDLNDQVKSHTLNLFRNGVT